MTLILETLKKLKIDEEDEEDESVEVPGTLVESEDEKSDGDLDEISDEVSEDEISEEEEEISEEEVEIEEVDNFEDFDNGTEENRDAVSMGDYEVKKTRTKRKPIQQKFIKEEKKIPPRKNKLYDKFSVDGITEVIMILMKKRLKSFKKSDISGKSTGFFEILIEQTKEIIELIKKEALFQCNLSIKEMKELISLKSEKRSNSSEPLTTNISKNVKVKSKDPGDTRKIPDWNVKLTKFKQLYTNLLYNFYSDFLDIDPSKSEKFFLLSKKDIEKHKIGFQSSKFDEDNKIIEEDVKKFAIVIEVLDGIYQCSKCKEWKVVKTILQICSGDEGFTVFLQCANLNKNCKNKWKLGK